MEFQFLGSKVRDKPTSGASVCRRFWASRLPGQGLGRGIPDLGALVHGEGYGPWLYRYGISGA